MEELADDAPTGAVVKLRSLNMTSTKAGIRKRKDVSFLFFRKSSKISLPPRVPAGTLAHKNLFNYK